MVHLFNNCCGISSESPQFLWDSTIYISVNLRIKLFHIYTKYTLLLWDSLSWYLLNSFSNIPTKWYCNQWRLRSACTHTQVLIHSCFKRREIISQGTGSPIKTECSRTFNVRWKLYSVFSYNSGTYILPSCSLNWRYILLSKYATWGCYNVIYVLIISYWI